MRAGAPPAVSPWALAGAPPAEIAAVPPPPLPSSADCWARPAALVLWYHVPPAPAQQGRLLPSSTCPQRAKPQLTCLSPPLPPTHPTAQTPEHHGRSIGCQLGAGSRCWGQRVSSGPQTFPPPEGAGNLHLRSEAEEREQPQLSPVPPVSAPPPPHCRDGATAPDGDAAINPVLAERPPAHRAGGLAWPAPYPLYACDTAVPCWELQDATACPLGPHPTRPHALQDKGRPSGPGWFLQSTVRFLQAPPKWWSPHISVRWSLSPGVCHPWAQPQALRCLGHGTANVSLLPQRS